MVYHSRLATDDPAEKMVVEPSELACGIIYVEKGTIPVDDPRYGPDDDD